MARQIRAGLEPAKESKSVPDDKFAPNPLSELYYGKPVSYHLTQFGLLLALISLIVGNYKGYHLKVADAGAAFILASALILIAYRAPRILHQPWRAWMGLAEWIGLGVTYILLSLTWVFMVIPMGVIVKLAGVRVMDLSFKADRASYWLDRKPGLDNFVRLEKQM